MSAREYRDLLLKRWWVVTLSIFFVGLGAVAVTFLTPPVYQAKALVRVDIPSTDVTMVLGVTRVVYTEAQMATGDVVLNDVAAHTPGFTVARLRTAVSAIPLGNDDIIQITALDSSASEASTIANAVARSLISLQETALRNNNTAALQPLQDAVKGTSTAILTTIAQLNALTATRGADPAQVAGLRAQLNMLQTQLAQQLTALSAVQEDQAKHGVYMYVAQSAESDVTTVRSVTLLNVGAGLAFGLLLGLLAVLIQDIASQRVSTVEALERLIGAPVLTELPSDALTQSALHAALAGQTTPHPGFLRLNSALTFLSVDRPIRALAVTRVRSSANISKSGVAAALAVSAAVQGQYTLIIDSDFATPSQHMLFGVRDAPGVSDAILYFHSPDALAEEFQRYYLAPTVVELPTLRVVPAGTKPPNPTRLLGSHAMATLYSAAMATPAQTIIVDAPSLLGTAAAAEVSALVDGAVLVVDRATMRRYDLVRAHQRIEDAGIRLLGCVCVGESLRRASPEGRAYREVAQVPQLSAPAVSPQYEPGESVSGARSVERS